MYAQMRAVKCDRAYACLLLTDDPTKTASSAADARAPPSKQYTKRSGVQALTPAKTPTHTNCFLSPPPSCHALAHLLQGARHAPAEPRKVGAAYSSSSFFLPFTLLGWPSVSSLVPKSRLSAASTPSNQRVVLVAHLVLVAPEAAAASRCAARAARAAPAPARRRAPAWALGSRAPAACANEHS